MNNLNLDTYKSYNAPSSSFGRLFTFAVLILIIIIGSFYFIRTIIGKLNQQILSLQKEKKHLEEAIPFEKEKEIISLEKKIEFLGEVFKNHSNVSNVLSILEKYTHPDIYYLSLRLNRKNANIQITGYAKSFEVLSEAINGFVNQPAVIQAVVLREAKLDPKTKLVSFSLNIYLVPDVLKYKEKYL